MGEYTTVLLNKSITISPEDENYKEELLEVVQSFRTFDAALDEFISKRGYDGALDDTDAKCRFIQEKFKQADIALDMRILESWFRRHTRARDRSIAFQFCFAFQLSLEETQEFFRQVYLQRGIDCHDMEEAIYYYCIRNKRNYTDAQKLLAQAPVPEQKGAVSLHGDVLFTGSIIRELDRFHTPDELLVFLHANKEQFGYNNATAKTYINRLWEKITESENLIEQEAELLYPNGAHSGKRRSVWDIYLQILGLLDYDEVNHSRLFFIRYDRTIKPLLKDNSLIHPLVDKDFPSRQGLEKIIKGRHLSSEIVRKTMIILAFYRFWAKRSVKNKTPEYQAAPGEAPECVAALNNLLVTCGYPALYAGNPYDWIFLFAAQDEYPLSAFRYFMREVYLNNEE